MGKITDRSIVDYTISQMVDMLRGDREIAEETGRFVRHEKGSSGEDIIYISEPQGEQLFIAKLEVTHLEIVR